MSKSLIRELPIRAKYQMVEDVAKVVGCLHRGERRAAEDLISDLKSRALYLDEEIQQDVLMFSNQVAFQYDYDPWHKVTLDVTQAADRLIDALVF